MRTSFNNCFLFVCKGVHLDSQVTQENPEDIAEKEMVTITLDYIFSSFCMHLLNSVTLPYAFFCYTHTHTLYLLHTCIYVCILFSHMDKHSFTRAHIYILSSTYLTILSSPSITSHLYLIFFSLPFSLYR